MNRKTGIRILAIAIAVVLALSLLLRPCRPSPHKQHFTEGNGTAVPLPSLLRSKPAVRKRNRHPSKSETDRERII